MRSSKYAVLTVSLVNRDLFLTLRTLRASGITAGSEPTDDGKMLVWLLGPGDAKRDAVRDSAHFYEFGEAADWLAAQALKLFPKSDFAKVARIFADALASVKPRHGRVRR
jgi:hypothetical protein